MEKKIIEFFEAGKYSEAKSYCEKLAEQGDACAQSYLGFMYDCGLGGPKDVQKAVEWWTKAADQGNILAQGSLGYMYHTGNGIPKDVQKAVEWYQKAAEQGDGESQLVLGKMYANGDDGGTTKPSKSYGMVPKSS